MTGKVYLVGAGPSDSGLLTLKGYEVLQKAQVVVYDALVGTSLLGMIPPQTRQIYVGKRAGHHTLPQEEINQLLLREAQAGLLVVRLKGGDSFLFGRGGEELETLAEAGIPFEVVPGVTSALAVPAYGGIPVTHRDYCSSVHIITGHTKKNPEAQTDYDALVRLHGTLVFLMGVTELEMICTELQKAGMSSAMPAAIIEQGTTARQRQILGTVSTLPELSQKEKIKAPAILIIGEVCTLSKKLNWVEKRPLYGCRLIVTRPKEKAAKMAAALRALGAEVLELPAISVCPVLPNPLLDDALRRLDAFRWLVFTSPSGVEVFLQHLRQIRFDLRRLGQIKIAAVGSATGKALETAGLFPDLIPKTFYTDALGHALSHESGPMLLVRAREGAPGLTQWIKSAKIPYEDIPLYDTHYEQSPLYLRTAELLATGEIDGVTFTSASTVHGFVCQVGKDSAKTVNAICIGTSTATAAAEYGMKVHIAKEPTIAAMTELMIELKKGSN